MLTRASSHRTATHPCHNRSWPLLLTAVLVLGACGDADGTADTPDEAPATDAAAAEEGDVDEGDAPDRDEEPVNDDGDDGVDDGGPVRDVGVLTAEDGWIEPHDQPLPEAGQLTLKVGGEDLLIDDMVCDGPGVVSDPESSHLFHFAFRTTEGVTSAGLPVWVSGSRTIVTAQRAEEEAFYDYVGQERTTVQIDVQQEDELFQSSITVSPSDWDPRGVELPLVHVDASGAFTVVAEIKALPLFHDEALAGATVIAGRCQDGWPDDLD